MDWKKTFNRGQWVIHSVFIVATLIGIGSTVFALRLNHLQSTEEERILKINALISELKTDQSFTKIGKYLSWAEADKAQNEIRKLSGRIVATEELLEIKASKDLGLSLRSFNKLLGNTSGMSNPSDALKVFKQKVSNLATLAKTRHYKNISLISERMEERLSQLNPKNVGGSIQVSYLKSDIARLNQLVNSAGLDDAEKKGLLERFESMSNEIELLTSLNSQSRDLKSHVNQATIALSQWLMDVEKKAGDFQGARNRSQNQLIIILASMVCFILTAWMGIAYMFRWQKNKMGEQVELEVKSVIEKGIMADQRFMMDHYTEVTRNDIIHLLDELKVKLNLGSMLHEGLPFAGCMIDGHFKVTWYNHIFLEQFYLSEEEVRSDAFSWDYLRDYLNLDEDPIYQALVNKIAGIYPVKMKQDEFTPMQPYEMYVTPISVNREERVMVFFYPLVAVKEAIAEQVNMSRMTLTRFTNLWNEDKMDEDELRLLEKDFKNNDLMDLYNDLSSLYERVSAEKAECIRNITALEKERSELESTVSDWEEADGVKKDIIKQEFKLAHEMRDSFIHTIERSEGLVNINRTILGQNDDLKNEAMKVHQLNQDGQKKTRETLEIMGQLEFVKADYKKLKFELLEVKTRLISINNSLFGQLPALDDNQQKLASRYKDELARLDLNVSTFDKKLSQLDVLLGKLQMMNNDKKPAPQINLQFHTSQKDHEIREALLEIQKALSSEQGKVVDHFKNLHQLMKKDLATTPEKDLPRDHSSLDSFLS